MERPSRMNFLDDALSAIADRVALFQSLVRDVPYERKGIPNSEMFFLWLCALPSKPTRILESGRARGQSTLMLARCFPDTEIISVEHDPNSPDVAVAAERLRGEANVNLLFGDAVSILPKIAKNGDIALLDGPKGFRGIRFALDLLATGKLPLVFVHDVGPGTTERSFLERFLRGARYSDEPAVVTHTHVLDDEEAMAIPVANRYAATELPGSPAGYGYGLACIPHDVAVSYRWLQIRSIATSLRGHRS